MDFYTLLNLTAFAAAVVLVLSLFGLVILFFLYLAQRNKIQRRKAGTSSPVKRSPLTASSRLFISSDNEPDIATFATKDIPKSGLFSPYESRTEYRRRGKSPSGVIDGVYNDTYRENGRPYNDMDRDWDADA